MHSTEDTNKYIRDPSSKALLNTDKKALEEYRRQNALVSRVSRLEEGVDEIKDLLRQLINNK